MPPPARPPVEEAAAGETAPLLRRRGNSGPPGRFVQPGPDPPPGLPPPRALLPAPRCCPAPWVPLSPAQSPVLRLRGVLSATARNPEPRDGTPSPRSICTARRFFSKIHSRENRPPGIDSPQKFYKPKSGRGTCPLDSDSGASQRHPSENLMASPLIVAYSAPGCIHN